MSAEESTANSAPSNAPSPAPAVAKKICVLVLGMHRSGTSALARVLNLMGCDLPKTLVESSESNSLGHWESRPVCTLNDAILESAGTNWHDWLEFNPDWRNSPKTAEFRKSALDTLKSEFGDSHLFVLKDPRICRATGLWLDVIDDFGASPAILFMIRNPLEVAESLKQRDGFETALGHLLWLRNVLDSEAQSRSHSRHFLSYDGLLADYSAILRSVRERFGFSWPRKEGGIGSELGAALSDKHRHHRKTKTNLAGDENLSEWLKTSFDIFDRWCAKGENTEDYVELDRIRDGLNVAAPAFSNLIGLGRYMQNQAVRLERKLAEHKESMEKQKESLQKKIDQAENEKGALQNEIAARFSEIAAMTKLLKETEADAFNLANRAEAAVSKIVGAPYLPLLRRVQTILRIRKLKRLGMFDAEWYLSHYKDVAEAGAEPTRHFVTSGAAEGRSPNPAVARARGEL